MVKYLKYLAVFLIVILHTSVYSQKISTSEYIEMYKDLAIQEMNKYHIPASIILAQGILESGNGNSKLARVGKNHFGIKCHNEWDGKTIKWDDDSKRECFRKYKTVADSYRDHSEFLATRNHYAPLFKIPSDDYVGWANGLQKAGYATNSNYSSLLIRIIENNNLHVYDAQNLLANNDNNNSYSPAENDFKPIDLTNENRPLYTNNGVKFIFAEAGDNFATIARDLNIYSWQVYKYNDLKKDDTIKEGQMLYIEKKKRKAKQEYHIVQQNESLYSIAQLYGIRLKSLLAKNKLSLNEQIHAGQKIRLK